MLRPIRRDSSKRLRHQWLRRNLALVVLVVAGTVVIGTVVSVLVLSTQMPGRLYVIGAVHAGLVATVLHLLSSAFLAHDQQAVWQLRGAWGEENTRSELQRAKRKRLIWGWVDSVELQSGDIDHIVVTRHGGVVAIDSKWRNQVTRETVPAMADSARRAALRADGVLRTLLKKESGARHRTRSQPVSVTPAVVLWGAARTWVPKDTTVNEVQFLDGRQLVDWLAVLEGHDVPRDAAHDVLKLLTDYRSTAVTPVK